jgi:hypothetical protein
MINPEIDKLKTADGTIKVSVMLSEEQVAIIASAMDIGLNDITQEDIEVFIADELRVW